MSKLDEIFQRVSVCISFRLHDLTYILSEYPPSEFELSKVPWQLGDLSTDGYISLNENSNLVDYRVNSQKAKSVLSKHKSQNPLPCSLHKSWTKWYQSVYEGEQGRYKIQDLASFLYHQCCDYKITSLGQCIYEESICKKCSIQRSPFQNKEPLLDFLKSETRAHLSKYYQSIYNILPGSDLPPQTELDNLSDSVLKSIRAGVITYLSKKHEDMLKQEVGDYLVKYIERIEGLEKFKEILSGNEHREYIRFLNMLN